MLKYEFAYIDDDRNNKISINDVTDEIIKLHTFHCIGCDEIIRPRALNSTKVTPHFYHDKNNSCSGETYLHRFAKEVIKDKFDTSSTFNISYPVTKECNNQKCKYRNIQCRKERSYNTVDLKKYYDTCTEEAPIKGFIADILLTNSKNPNVEPILIEVCVSHPCDEDKRNSGLKIIEISIRDEEDIKQLQSTDEILEPLVYVKKKKEKAEFISFKREIQVPLQVRIQRYVHILEHTPSEYLTKINCIDAHRKIRKDSLEEFNVVNTQNYGDFNLQEIHYWMSRNKGLRRCNLCKFYYQTEYEDSPICRLSKKYGKPVHPSMDEAEKCNSYKLEGSYKPFNWENLFVEEVTSYSPPVKPEYKVILAVSSSFGNYENFYEHFKGNVLYYLSNKIETHTIIIITGVSKLTDMLTNELLSEVDFIKEPHKAEWDKYGQNAIKNSNNEMTTDADALIAFWDEKSKGIKDIIEQAKQKGKKVAIVPYINFTKYTI